MTDIKVQTVRERDSSGQLVRAGIHWREPRDMLPALGWLLPGAGTLCLIITLAVSTNPYESRNAFFMAVATLFLFITGLWCRKNAVRDAGLVFHRDGTIQTPFGVPNFRHYRTIPGSHANLASFEFYERVNGAYGVRFVSHGGDKGAVGEYLSENDAFKIVVQLNTALLEMRSHAVASSAVTPHLAAIS